MPNRCQTGFHRNKKTGNCELKYNYHSKHYNKGNVDTMIFTKRKFKCPKGTRKVGKSGKCSNKRLKKMSSKNRNWFNDLFGKQL
jgi:hypothetical protein